MFHLVSRRTGPILASIFFIMTAAGSEAGNETTFHSSSAILIYEAYSTNLKLGDDVTSVPGTSLLISLGHRYSNRENASRPLLSSLHLFEHFCPII